MQAVVQDPRVGAMVTRHRGEKGYRVHQGERLRQTLLNMITEEVWQSARVMNS